MSPLVDRAVKAALRLGMRKGLGDGSRVWLAVGAAAVGVRLLQRMAASGQECISEELAPGQVLVITHLRRDPGDAGQRPGHP